MMSVAPTKQTRQHAAAHPLVTTHSEPEQRSHREIVVAPQGCGLEGRIRPSPGKPRQTHLDIGCEVLGQLGHRQAEHEPPHHAHPEHRGRFVPEDSSPAQLDQVKARGVQPVESLEGLQGS